MKEHIKLASELYEQANSSLTSYYNTPHNYTRIVSLLNDNFSLLLESSFIAKVFKSKQALHKIEKAYTLSKIRLDFANTKFVMEEYKLDKKYRIEARKAGIEAESAIVAHIEFRKTDFTLEFFDFNQYVDAIETLMKFFHSEMRNVDNLLSQGKALSYSGHKFHDSTSLFGYDNED